MFEKIKRKSRSLVAIFSLAFLLIASHDTLAESASEVDELTRDFLTAAIGQKYWIYTLDRLRESNDPYARYFEEVLREHSVNYDRGEVIHKWKTPIVVEASGDDIIDEQVRGFITRLSGIDGLSIVGQGTAGAGRPNLRIHLYGGADEIREPEYRLGLGGGGVDHLTNGWRYKLNWPRIIYVDKKLGHYEPPYDLSRLFGEKFVLYRDAILFTPGLKIQVEGYMASNEQHGITRVECYILARHEPESKRALAAECIIRGLGFPTALNQDKSSILSARDEEQPTMWLSTPSVNDIHLVEALYDKRIEPGMDMTVAEPIIRRFFSTLQGNQARDRTQSGIDGGLNRKDEQNAQALAKAMVRETHLSWLKWRFFNRLTKSRL